jgi:hypothetical protein
MSSQAHLLTGVILCSVLFAKLAQSEDLPCHLHAPADYANFSKQPLVIPNVGDPAECEQFNLQRFSARGRCHCVQDRVSIQGRERPMDFSSATNQPELLP